MTLVAAARRLSFALASVLASVLASAPAAQQAAVDRPEVRAEDDDGAVRAAALVRLHRRGELDPEALARALADASDEVRTVAARIVRHTVADVPVAVQQVLDAQATARLALLAELAEAPRPAFAAFVAREAASENPTIRLLALAARTEPPTREEARFALERLAAEADRTAALACARMDPKVADALVSQLHAHLAAGLPPERVRPFLERLSPIGVRQLLGLSLTLPEDAAAPLVDFLAQREDPEFFARLRAMLDGDQPVLASWVRRSGKELGDANRRARVAALCTKATATSATANDVAVGVAAFEALLDAGVYEPALTAFARAGRDDRWRRLAQRPLRGMPKDLFEHELEFEHALATDAVAMLRVLSSSGQPLSSALEQRLAAFARSELDVPAGRESATFREALRVLAVAGGDEGAAIAVQLAGRDVPSLVAVAEHFAHRKDPVGAEALRLLLHELPTSVDAFGDLRRTILLLLAETGHPIEVGEIAAVAATLRPSFLHRCRVSVKRLSERDTATVLAQLPAAAPEVRAELLQWLAASPGEAVRKALHDGLASESEEVKEAAFEALLRTGEREALLRAGREAFGADPAQDELFVCAALATLGQPWSATDLDFVQWLLFTAPRRDPTERQRAAHFADARAGFPVVSALAANLRPARDRALAAVLPARDLARRGDVDGLVRQRFLFLWTALQADPELLAQVARATAGLVLAIPDENGAGEGVASYYAAQDAEARGEFAAAVPLADAAVSGLLLDQASTIDQRIHLGVREPLLGFDAHAHLAAAPHRLRARAALLQNDREAAVAALALAREFAGRDAATLRAVESLEQDLR